MDDPAKISADPLGPNEPQAKENAAGTDQLVHLIYDTALDNSLWPELIVTIYQCLDSASDQARQAEMQTLQSHFARGLLLSERMVALQEENDLQARLLGSLAVEVQLFDTAGRVLARTGPQAASLPNGAVTPMPAKQEVHLGPDDLRQLGLPQQVSSAKIRFVRSPADIVQSLPGISALAKSRQGLLAAFLHHANLKDAAAERGLSYETARTYLKDICAHFGVSGQSALLQAVLLDPASLLIRQAADTNQEVRRRIPRPDQGQLEYFALGPKTGQALVHFDALSGGALDVLGAPQRYAPLLETLKLRLIIPCRPGTFGSSFRALHSARDHASDIALLCDRLQIDRFSILAYSHGTIPALGVAAELGDRIDRLTIASASFPDHVAADWRNLDFFYQVTQIIGRKWPALQRRIVPFLIKSILQNIDSYADRAARSAEEGAECPHEGSILRDPEIRERSRAMLEGRIAAGMDGMVQEYRIAAQPMMLDWAQVAMPVQIFHGHKDQINPFAGAKALKRVLPNATLQGLPDMGHAFVYAEWDWLLEAAAGRPVQPPTAWRRGILRSAGLTP
jgi:pimeloyl-ACP methyl ester carboxylesterase